MTTSIRSHLKRANTLASNGLWPQAVDTYEYVLNKLYDSIRLSAECTSTKLVDQAVRALPGPDRFPGYTSVDFSAPLVADVLLELRRKLEQAQARFMSSFPCRWDAVDEGCERSFRGHVIVFHGQRQIGPPTSNSIENAIFPLEVPCGDTAAFLYIEEYALVRIPTLKVAQISYALSHRAWAKVNIAIQLYSVANVLIGTGVRQICINAAGFFQALLLKPDESWAFSHIGETSRIIANAWQPCFPPEDPQEAPEIFTRDRKARKYIIALCYFARAIQIDPFDYWAWAHLGAAIVNVRGFIGTATDSPIDRDTETWLVDKMMPLLTDRSPSVADFLELAYRALDRAQRLQGNFYPWAQAYAADVLIIQNIRNMESAKELGVLATTLTLSAIWFAPALAGGLFEPSQLYENPFFSAGLTNAWCGQYVQAWQYVYIGLSRSFKFQFIPGLDVLLGCQLLASIAYLKMVHVSKDWDSDTMDARLPDYVLSQPLQIPMSIPREPFDDVRELAKFISGVVTAICIPLVITHLHQKQQTNVYVGLLQTFYTLVDLRAILEYENRVPLELMSSSKDQLNGLISRLEAQLQLEVPKPCTNLAVYLKERLFGQVQGLGLSYHMLPPSSRNMTSEAARATAQ